MMKNTLIPLLDVLPLAILVIGVDGRVVATNAPLSAILGDGLVGLHHISALRQPAILDAVAAAIQQRKPITTRYLGQDAGKDTTYQVTVSPFDDKIAVTFEDLTAIEDVGKLRRDFVANVSHELRTPLTALMGFIETLRGAARDDPAARDRFLTIMEREAGRMTRLVDDLLSLSRVEEDGRVRPQDPVDVADVLKATLSGLEPVIAAAECTIDLQIADGLAQPLGDAGQLRQVFANLIENAIKYGGSGKVIAIHLSAPRYEPKMRGEGMRISVIDRGVGVASHHIARLTERFYRVDSHRSREVGGTGLGLAIVKHIINRHRGRLQIESVLGEGTQCTVILPLE